MAERTISEHMRESPELFRRLLIQNQDSGAKAVNVTVKGDATRLLKALSSAELLNLPLDVANGLEQWFRVKTLTTGAGEVTVRFYPSKSLLDLLSTLRARKRKNRLVKAARH